MKVQNRHLSRTALYLYLIACVIGCVLPPASAAQTGFSVDRETAGRQESIESSRAGAGAVSGSTYTLSVKLDPPEGGSVVSSPPGIDSPKVSRAAFDSGTEVKLTADPKPGWNFAFWYDGKDMYSDVSVAFTMSANKALTAAFRPRDSVISLRAADFDTAPLGTRIPLILVHGNNNEKEGKYSAWDHYAAAIKKDPSFRKRYKTYLFRWDSNSSNLINGLAFGSSIDSRHEFANRDLVILAHSRGGIISRYFMNYYKINSGNRKGRPGGEKVMSLVTLATPHRGSPGADPVWVNFSVDRYFGSEAIFISGVYTFFVYKKNHKFLLWDDVDNELTKDQVCWDSSIYGEYICKALDTNFSDLVRLNTKERFAGKIIAYGGNTYESKWGIEKAIALGKEAYSNNGSASLSIASILMAMMPIIPIGYDKVPINDSYKRFIANDGLVPLTSALFLKPGCSGIFKVSSKGKLIYSTEKLKQFQMTRDIVVINDRPINHEDFIDDSGIIGRVMRDLKILQF